MQASEIFKGATQPVELPDQERIAGLYLGEQLAQGRTLFQGRRHLLHDLLAALGPPGIQLSEQLLLLGRYPRIAPPDPFVSLSQ
jgi:hypothetical protein